MNVDEYLNSAEFRSFLDEGLCEEAQKAAETIAGKVKNADRKGRCKVKRHQLYSITTVLQAGGAGKLVKFAQKQKDKNTKKENNTLKENNTFWSEIYDIVNMGARTELSLFLIVEKELEKFGMIKNIPQGQGKKEQNKIKNENKENVKKVMNDKLMKVYFEHFNCHFFYKTNSN